VREDGSGECKLTKETINEWPDWPMLFGVKTNSLCCNGATQPAKNGNGGRGIDEMTDEAQRFVGAAKVTMMAPGRA
jgi:hypothetical protein